MDGTALIFAESALGTPLARTANNLLRFSRRYEVLGVIDSRHAGREAGAVVEGAQPSIPVFANLDDALSKLAARPRRLVIGLNPDNDQLPPCFFPVIREALRQKVGVDSALRPYLHDHAEFPMLAMQCPTPMRSIGYPVPLARLRSFTGGIKNIPALKVAVVGTTRPTGGKNVTAVRLTETLNRRGVAAEMIGTSVASWFQGVRHTVLLDSILHGYVAGELEATVLEAYVERQPRVMVLEGDGSPLHRQKPTGLELLTTAAPDLIVLQHAPAHAEFGGVDPLGLACVERHVEAVAAIAGCPVIAVALSHIGFTGHADFTGDEREACARAADRIRAAFDVPVVDVLAEGADRLADLVCRRLPQTAAA